MFSLVPALIGGIGIGEVRVQPQGLGDVFVVREFAAVIEGDGLCPVGGQAPELVDGGLGDAVGMTGAEQCSP